MARYIDVDEAIINFGFEYEDIPPTLEEFIDFLKRQKVIDAVPVVRCKDCKHGKPCYGHELIKYCDEFPGEEYLDANHYCSYGERKGGDE